jgi:hypothetical protein
MKGWHFTWRKIRKKGGRIEIEGSRFKVQGSRLSKRCNVIWIIDDITVGAGPRACPLLAF